jgi:hypothetical protein
VVKRAWEAKPAGSAGGLMKIDVLGGLRGGSFFHGPADVDDVVGDDPEANPALHSDVALVATAAEAVSPFDDADASLASGAPFLTVAEPPLLLLTFYARGSLSSGWECRRA